MANKDRPFGFKAIRHLNGNKWNDQTRTCVILAAVTNAIGIGDAVLLQGTADDNGIPAIDLASAGDGNYISGIVTGFKPRPDDLNPVHRTAAAKSDDYYCEVCMDPDVVFQIQDDGAAALTKADIGLNANIILTHSVSSQGISGTELDTNSDPPDADPSNQLLILGLAQIAGNAIGVHAVWEVLINMHSLRTPATGV